MTLHEHVPEGIINYNHHVDSVKVADDGVEINFKSQPTQKVDLLVAADGLYSRTRKQYIPDDAVLYRGLVAYRAVFPETLVSHISDLPNDTSVYRRNGENVFLSRIGLGQYGIVALIRETPDLASSLTWARSIGGSGMDRIRSHFASWDPVVTSVLAVVPDFAAYPLESAAWLEKLTRDDRIAFVGDAAHPTAGAFGAGTTVGFGDCWALMRALEHSSTTSNSTLQPYTSTATSARTTPAISHTYDLPCALRLYNETRCHFLARFQAQLMREVANVAYISEAGDEGPEWLARYQERFAPQWWLTEHDVEEEFRRTAEAADQVHEMVGQR
jgi:salicylate hydroxylase